MGASTLKKFFSFFFHFFSFFCMILIDKVYASCDTYSIKRARKAHKERQMTKMTKIEKMIELGGKEWKAGDKHRIYFNGEIADAMIGLEKNVYGRESKKGYNCRSSWLRGEEISNNKAFSLSKNFYYDVVSGKFVGNASEIVISFE